MLAASAKQYHQVYEMQIDPPLYAAPWWLDATCGSGGWEVIQLKNQVSGSSALVPYYNTKIRGLTSLINPPMTQWLPMLRSENTYKIALNDFFLSLPPYSILDVSFKPGPHVEPSSSPYDTHLKYSYVIQSNEKDAEQIRKGYNEGLRRNLKEAVKIFHVAAAEDIPAFIRLCESTFDQRKIKAPEWLRHVIPSVYSSLMQNNSGKLEFAFLDGKAIAAILIAWDKETTYYLAGGRTNDDPGASAHGLLLDNAIIRAQTKRMRFDFEGSMHPGIANFFQSFGASPESYWQVRKFRGVGKLWSLFH